MHHEAWETFIPSSISLKSSYVSLIVPELTIYFILFYLILKILLFSFILFVDICCQVYFVCFFSKLYCSTNVWFLPTSLARQSKKAYLLIDFSDYLQISVWVYQLFGLLYDSMKRLILIFFQLCPRCCFPPALPSFATLKSSSRSETCWSQPFHPSFYTP